MKAITCTQCGALIKRISLKEKFAHCDYCGAKILLAENKDNIIEIPNQKEKELTPWQQHQENYRKLRERTQLYDSPPVNYPEENRNILTIIVIFALAMLLFGFGLSKGCNYRPLGDNETKVSNNLTSPPIDYSTPTPTPKISYEARVEWASITLMEQYVIPQIDAAKLLTFDKAELKKTVFKNRRVQVRVTIDSEGNVISAEGVSGHPVLQEAAIKAARQTLFKRQKNNITHTLTYYFRLTEE